MIDQLINQWYENKDKLRVELQNTPLDLDYSDLVSMVFEIATPNVITEWGRELEFNTSEIKIIDYGDYQGTQIFIIPLKTYQPTINQTYYTSVDYGSCSGCDTLIGITGCGSGLPDNQQVDDLMTLCLHLVQNTRKMGE